jgi:hypothetical protein
VGLDVVVVVGVVLADINGESEEVRIQVSASCFFQ